MAEIIYPYGDDAMVYDLDEHRYILTEQCVLKELNINLGVRLNSRGSATVQKVPSEILDQISQTIYGEIYKCSIFNDFQEYLLAKMPSARKIIKEAMKQQVLYFLVNGDTSRYSGIDIKNSKALDLKVLRNKSVLDPRTEQILWKPIKETGLSILYSGYYSINYDFSYEKDNY